MAKNIQPLMLLCLDAEKTSDRVDWQFFEPVLMKTRFGKKNVNWFQL